MRTALTLTLSRREKVSVLALALLVALLAPACTLLRPQTSAATPPPAVPATRAPAAIPNFGHVFIIVMENKEYGEIIGSDDAPYINNLARTYALATRYYAIRHPSLPNYLALVSGSTQGMTSDCSDCSFKAPNLADQLEAHQRSWGADMEDMPEPCYNGAYAGGPLAFLGVASYARKHNPWMYFEDITSDPARCGRVVPFTQLATDLAAGKLPDFVWITPNLKHDMHNGTVADGDGWLATTVPPLLASPAWRDNGVLFIVWDEGTSDAGCCGNAAGGHTPAIVVAADGKRGYQSPFPYSHYSLLRTIEDAWQLGYLDHAADPGTQAMSDFFK